MAEQIKAFFQKHRFAVLVGILGLLVAVLFLCLGFWRTVLLGLLVGIGVNIGIKLDRNMSFAEILLSWGQFWRKLVSIIRSWFHSRS